jgi:hypothetical protein
MENDALDSDEFKRLIRNLVNNSQWGHHINKEENQKRDIEKLCHYIRKNVLRIRGAE